MDRDIAMSLNTKLGAVNTALQGIVNGIANTPASNRTIPAGDKRSAPAEDPEEPEAPEEPETPEEEPETRTKK